MLKILTLIAALFILTACDTEKEDFGPFPDGKTCEKQVTE